MSANILRIEVFEAAKSLAVKENQNGDDLGIGKTSGIVAMHFPVAELMFS